MSTNPKARAWVTVRADALIRNARAVQASVDPARLIPMVKADAYGLGVEQAVRALEAVDPWGYGVATADEGVRLRALGVTRPVVVYSPLPPQAVETAVGARLQVGVSNLEGLRRLAEAASLSRTSTAFHLEIDTGIGRAGFDARDVAEWGPKLADASGALRWVGVYTHLHSADEDRDTIVVQLGAFRAALDSLELPDDVLIHALNSAGSLVAPAHRLDAVRPGIFLYGGCVETSEVEPEAVASVHARVTHLRDARPGDAVGYGETHRAAESERWATLAIGYGDGLPRGLGNNGRALLHGRSAPIVGRISMDVTVVDITGIPGVQIGDVATLIGSDGSERIPLDEVASRVGTISYEVLTGLGSRLPRVWTEDDGD